MGNQQAGIGPIVQRSPKRFAFVVPRAASVALAIAAVFFASVPPDAQAGLLGMFAGRVAGHVVERKIEHKIEGAKSPVLVLGRDGPLAPSSNEGFAACPQLFPKSAPIDVSAVSARWRAVGLCSNHFAVLSSALSKTPLVVIEKLNSSMLADAKGQKRTNEFYADPRLARGSRAELIDYKSGDDNGKHYDHGHLANAADQPDQQSMIQSFALSNMVPQDPMNTPTAKPEL